MTPVKGIQLEELEDGVALGQSIVTSNTSNTNYAVDRKLPKGR